MLSSRLAVLAALGAIGMGGMPAALPDSHDIPIDVPRAPRASDPEIEALREERRRRKAENFAKRLPKQKKEVP